jgi:rsbT antagonist protein RsbS
MRASILKQREILIASVQGSMSDLDLTQLREQLLQDVRRYRTTGVIVDVTLIDVMDSFAARTLRGISQVVKLLGARVVIVGIQPDVAFAMVQLGLTDRLKGVLTALDLQDAVSLLRRRRTEPGS